MSALACKIRLIRNIRFIRIIISLSRSAEDSCHSSNSCSQKNLVFPLPAQRRTFVLFELSVFKEKSRVHVPFPRQRGTFVSFEKFVFKKISCSKSLLAQRRKFVSFELFVFKRKIPCSQENYPCSHPHAKIIKIH